MPKTTLSAAELARNFAALHPPFSRDEAVAQASRCVFCYDAPCTRACPTHIDVPRFIRQILHGNPAGAAETILTDNVLGGSCARVCPTEVLCEGACVDRTLQGGPVPIGLLQRYATDHADRQGLRLFAPGSATGKRVAVVGAGPAGLSCAFELRRQGHAVTIFEARDLAGGLNALGIAAYKIDTEFALSEVKRVTDMGAELRVDSPIDASALAQLRDDYNAVFLGLGLGKTAGLGIPGEELPGVWEALDFIFQTHRLSLGDCQVGKRVLVFGGGNTAIDAATAARRLGAERCTLVYRRTPLEMPAYAHEFELAKADGVDFVWLAAPLEFLAEEGRLCGARCQRLRAEGAGRAAKLVPAADGSFILDCDMAIKALGQTPLGSLLASIDGLDLDRGAPRVDPATGATSLPGLYAGGDCVSRGAEVVNAVQEGKIAARGIVAYLADGAAVS